jgi:hypothetical protein
MITPASFIAFIRAQKITVTANGAVSTFQIDAVMLPDTAPEIEYFLNWSKCTVWDVIQRICPFDYENAVYALAFHMMILRCFTVDIFHTIRAGMELNNRYQGVLSSTSDQSTSSSFDNPDYYKSIHPSEIHYQKTLWGRLYFDIVSQYSAIYGFAAG